MRKCELSRTSIPVARTGKVWRFGVVVEGGGARTGGTGESCAVMACILDAHQWKFIRPEDCDLPMKRSSEHEIVIAGELAHARVELAIVDETARLADDEQREHHPTL